jgi:hypothetical protein
MEINLLKFKEKVMIKLFDSKEKEICKVTTCLF